jgi:hypothetical protein
MMRACRSVGSFLSLVLPVGSAAFLTGCPEAPPAPAPMPTPTPSAQPSQPMMSDPSTLMELPGTRVGSVSGVTPADSLAAVGGVATDGVTPGDVVTFTDHQRSVVSDGNVVSILTVPNSNPPKMFVMVKYVVSPGGRPPVFGDWVEFAAKQ